MSLVFFLKPMLTEPFRVHGRAKQRNFLNLAKKSSKTTSHGGSPCRMSSYFCGEIGLEPEVEQDLLNA